MPEFLSMKVTAKKDLAPDVCEFVLTPVTGGSLPAAAAGSHIGVQTPGGAMRQYSLVHPNADPQTYTIAVKRELGGRGGSTAIHTLQAGDTLQVIPPENNFPLQDAPGYLLIAGGIGITPVYAMAQTLIEQEADFRLIYCARSGEDAVYLSDLQSLLGNRLTAHFDNGDAAQVYDFWDHFAEPGKEHVYCCGPASLMEEIKGISGHWPDNSVHYEDFAGVSAVRESDQPFEVILRKSALTLTVPEDQSILETLREAGISTVSSCESGTCGTCKCRLIAGDADHRDMVLMEDEKDTHIMICVSRAASGGLTIDL